LIRFQDGPKPRSYLSRREQWRLFLLVMSLGIVFIFMCEIRKPEHWEWIKSPEDAEQTQPPRRPERPPADSAPAARSEAVGPPSRFFPGVKPTYFDSVRDNTRFRNEERDAWFHLFAILRDNDEATLRKASTGRVTRLQLFEQSAEYRGELVTVHGTIRRTQYRKAPENQYGIPGYYQIWLQPRDNPNLPIVVYCLHLPKGFPKGTKVAKDVEIDAEITGFYFKRWVRQVQDGLEIIPTILARTVHWKKRPEPVATRPLGAGSLIAVIVTALVGSVLIVGYIYLRTGRGKWLPRGAMMGAMPTLAVGMFCFPVLLNMPTASVGMAPNFPQSREFFRLAGVDREHFDRLVDGRPWHVDEDETLQKVMFALRKFRLRDIEDWAGTQYDPSRLTQDAARGRFFRLRGRVVSIHVLRPPPEVARRFELDEYYRVEFHLDDRDQPAVIFTRVVPRAWQREGPIDQPAAALGVFLKLGTPTTASGATAGLSSSVSGTAGQASSGTRPVPIFAARRIAWRPDTLLGRLGMDVGLLDDLRDRWPITARERECFYQMLAAVGRARPGQLLREARGGSSSVEPLFNRPGGQRGRLVVLAGTTRRVVRVRVDEPDIRERFGIDHYYEMYLFTDDSQGNPLVVCVRRLPKGMPTGDDPQFAEYVEVAGFFLKGWAYRPNPAAQESTGGRADPRRVAPLLIGREPVWRPPQKPAGRPWVAAIASGLFLLVLLGIWFALWRYSRGDRKFRARWLDRRVTDGGILDKTGKDT
jgi:hypothetical protein